MKSQKKISLISMMMISSQILLSLFIAYWLYNQFIENKNFLSSEIERGLRNAEEQVIDSMLASNIINPIINDTSNMVTYFDSIDKGNPVKMKMMIESNPHVLMQISDDQSGDIVSKQHVISTIDRIDSSFDITNPGMQSTITVSAEPDSSNQLLFQGIKLLINSVGNVNMEQRNVFAYFSEDVDTALVMRTFNNYFNKFHSSFTVTWQPITKSEINESPYNKIFFTSYLFKDPYGIQITDYTYYLLKSISSQIAFALILLLITALAFRMAFINMKNQLKLITIKNDFISNITHELKTPVSTVKVALEALLDFNLREDPHRTKEYLEMAHSEMNRLDILVNQVLNNSALEEGNNFLNPETNNLVSLINEIIQSMQPRFQKQKAKVRFNYSEDNISVFADKIHLQGVIINLLDNSLKYTSVTPEISIDINKTNRDTTISIKDNGMGIPEEYITKIFDKFFRVPKGNEHSVKGYGLGLNYAALVMQQHGGEITANNNKDSGCKFTLNLPNKK